LKFQQKAPVGFSTGLSTGQFCDVSHFTQRCDFSHKNIFQNVRFVMIFDLKMSDQNDRLEA